MEALAECQNMVDDLQQYSYDQGRDLAAAQTQLQVLGAVILSMLTRCAIDCATCSGARAGSKQCC
jgi:hypothetical protein